MTNPDIAQFRDNGGKLILWAGWNDPLWSQQNIVNYYKQIIARNSRPAPGRPINTPGQGAEAMARGMVAEGGGLDPGGVAQEDAAHRLLHVRAGQLTRT